MQPSHTFRQPSFLMPPVQADQIRAVVFDAYGTLVQIADKRRPYRQLQELLPPWSAYREAFGQIVMSEPMDLEGAARRIELALQPTVLAQLQRDLKQELASIRLFDDVTCCLSELRERGIKLAICSNLAAPYASPVEQLTGVAWDVAAWSFAVGAVKPQRAMYEWTCQRLGFSANNVIMIGDTEIEDYVAPTSFGMQAIRLRRETSNADMPSITSLSELLPLIEPRLPAR